MGNGRTGESSAALPDAALRDPDADADPELDETVLWGPGDTTGCDSV